MRDKKRVGFQSSLLVTAGVVVCAFGGAVFSWRMELTGLAILLITVGATGLLSRLWGFYALKNVEAEVRADRSTLSAGQTVKFRYTVRNRKSIPLVWLELCQDVPERGCLIPDDSFLLQTFSEEEAENTGRKEAYMRRLSFFAGWSEQEWETVWTGEHRGVYRPRKLVLRSGDGFGLTQSTGEVPGLCDRMIVVWPKIVPVETGLFLRNVWSGSAGKAGWSEDPAVVRGVRAYEPGDAWKRIDWRTAARTDELMVRQYDTITPLSVFFILDVASLENPEEGISLLASSILALERDGVKCGLALPATKKQPSILFHPEDPSVTPERCLFALAAFSAETAGGRFEEAAVMTCAAGSGQTWFMAGSAAGISCPGFAERLSARGAGLLSEKREPGGNFLSREYTFRELRQKEVHS